MTKNKDKPSNIPNIPMSLHTKELFERSEKAIKKIKKKLERLD
jgi:hypothetical protein